MAVYGRGFWGAFTGHKSTTDAWGRYQDGQFLRTDMRPMGFQFGSVEFIGSDDAYLISGVDGLLVTQYAPADYMDTVNPMGQKFYASQEPQPHNKGVDLESQSNPLSICSRPRAIIKLGRA
ncbi:major capsid protein [Azotobacter beijerinckii]|uniref:Phage major capsid protein E n=1 Tax=Azotobacter beijerinckii TaxID=170623 RepID=A0A1I3Z3G4_9GAMM|nr:Phage major capsid protein E [Azotobacter beijerinckii]